jgi:predicted DNA-binding protein (MmcQ/YjbR family)
MPTKFWILFIEKGVTESFPFDNETLVLKVGTKVFLLMGLERQPLGINVKTDPNGAQNFANSILRLQALIT